MISEVIESVGIEVEGGICSEDLAVLNMLYDGNRFEFGYDGSVRVRPPSNRSCNWISDGEIKYWSTSLAELIEFVNDVFKYIKQNESCGNHIHLRIRKPYHLYIVSREFIEDFRREYEEFVKKVRSEKYKKRMENRYCKFPSNEYDYVHNIYAIDRYYAINFCSFMERQKTLEVRIMPYARTAKEYIRNLLWVVRTINKLVNKHAVGFDNKIDFNVDGNGIESIEERVEEIEGEI